MDLILGNIAELRSGYTFRGGVNLQPEGNTQVYMARDVIEDGRLPLATIDYANPSAYLATGDVLLSIRDNFQAMVADKHDRPAVAAAAVMVIRLQSGPLLPQYIALYFNSAQGQHALRGLATGSAIKTVTKAKLQGLAIPAISLEQQSRLISLSKNISQQQELLQQRRWLLGSIDRNILTAALNENVA